jgi:threonine dehydrogenase-like Zn-dependent dehydrogenase
VVLDAIAKTAPAGVACLTGVSTIGGHARVDIGGVNRELVLENNAVFGTVNANRRHYEQGAAALAKAHRGWLERLVTRRVPLERAADGLGPQPDDVKVVIDIGELA